jgi:hypothetical protein
VLCEAFFAQDDRCESSTATAQGQQPLTRAKLKDVSILLAGVMARYVLFAFGLLALCVQVSADYWPAGIKGASELETSSTPVAVSAKYDKEHSKYKSGHKHG